MGKDFYETYPAAREVFALAGEVTGLSMEKLIFEESEKLHRHAGNRGGCLESTG